MPVVTRVEDRVATLVLSRPETLNAFSQDLLRDLSSALAAAATAPEVAVVVLTGAGRAFSSGADLGELSRVTGKKREVHAPASGDVAPRSTVFDEVIAALAAFPKPLLMAVNGVAVGFGTTILGFADLVFMSTEARLKCPFTEYGVASEAASSYLLPRLIGRQNAAWLLLSSEWVSAEEALEMGIAWKLCSPKSLLETTYDHARLLAARPSIGLANVKAALNAPLLGPVAAAHELETSQFATLLG